MQRQRGLARAFRAIHFNHAAFGQAADAKCNIEPERSGRNRFDIHRFLGAQLHGRTLAESAINLRECRVEGLLTIHVLFLTFYQLETCCHDTASISCLERR